jgi:hypothetical protein
VAKVQAKVLALDITSLVGMHEVMG